MYESQSDESLDLAGWLWGKEGRRKGGRNWIWSTFMKCLLCLDLCGIRKEWKLGSLRTKGPSLRTWTGMTPATWTWRRGKRGGRQRQGHARLDSTGPWKQMSHSVSVKEWPYPWYCSFRGNFIFIHFALDTHLLHPLNGNKSPMLLLTLIKQLLLTMRCFPWSIMLVCFVHT